MSAFLGVTAAPLLLIKSLIRSEKVNRPLQSILKIWSNTSDLPTDVLASQVQLFLLLVEETHAAAGERGAPPQGCGPPSGSGCTLQIKAHAASTEAQI